MVEASDQPNMTLILKVLNDLRCFTEMVQYLDAHCHLTIHSINRKRKNTGVISRLPVIIPIFPFFEQNGSKKNKDHRGLYPIPNLPANKDI
jgi:hypothetical protein